LQGSKPRRDGLCNRLRWSGWIKGAFLGWTLVFNMVPPLTLVGPWYLIFREIGLFESLFAVILAHITLHLPMTVWMMMAYFGDLPKDIEEAAMVDGCRRIDAFWRISLPLVWPSLAPPYADLFAWVEGRAARPASGDPAPFRPPMLSHAIEEADFASLDPADFGARRVDELSGGQMRRVVLAGVIASQPRAIVLDEPFAGLDADGRAELDTVLSGLRRRHDIALVIVSHDRDLPAGLVDRIVELEAGRITRDEPLEDVFPGAQP